MILDELCRLYERMADDPSCQVPKPGWSNEKVAWEVTLTADGECASLVSCVSGEGKDKKNYTEMSVPEHGNRTSGVKPYFLCDTAAYFFGIDEKNGEKKRDASRTLHEAVLKECEDPGARAIMAFFEREGQGTLSGQYALNLREGGGLIVFSLLGDEGPIHARPAVAQAWREYLDRSSDAPIGMCSVSGKRGPLARLFPQVTGIPGAQSAGASLVSFNFNATESYGREQAYNASISEHVAFASGAALKALMSDKSRRIPFGSTQVVFWSDRPAPLENDVMQMLLLGEAPKGAEDKATNMTVSECLLNIRKGKPTAGLDGTVRFFILGIAPNAARLSVRFFEESTFGALAEHFGEYLRDVAIEGVETTSLRRLLLQTAPLGKAENVPNTLVNRCFASMISGKDFPQALGQLVLSRMRADHAANNVWDMGQRAALLKACYVRKRRNQGMKTSKEELMDVSLNRENANIGYVLGRLFAVMERAQQAALGETNATIRDRYIGAAATTPKRVFTPLLRGYHVHASMLRKNNPGLYRVLESEMDEIVGNRLDGMLAVPSALDSDGQAEFNIGYFQERTDLWKSRTKKNASEPNEETEGDALAIEEE